MSIKKIFSLVVLALFYFFPSIVGAQTDTLRQAGVREKSIAMTDRLQRELSLADEQRDQVLIVIQERFHDLSDKASSEKEEGKRNEQRFTRANEKALRSLRYILTTEQYNRYQDLRSETKKQKDAFLKAHPGHRFSDEDLELDF